MSDEAWTRYLEGESLSPEQHAQLAAELARPERLAARLDDLELHRALTHLGPRAQPARPVPAPPPPRLLRVVAGLCAAAAIFALGVGWGGARSRDASLPPAPIVPAPATFASLELGSARFAAPPAPDGRLSTGSLELLGGRARVSFDHGVTLDLEGPARIELSSAAAVRVERGRLALRVPADLWAFAVHTPSARIVDSGTAFELEVLPGGETLVRVLEADLRLEPGRGGQWSGRDLRLARSGLHSGRVTPLVAGYGESPLVAEASGSPGSFSALLVAGGRYVEVTRPELLESVRRYFRELLERSPDDFDHEWQRIAFRGNAPRIRLGSGAEVELTSIDDVLDARGLVARHMLASDPRVTASFMLPIHPSSQSGILQVAGQHWQFQDYETLVALLDALRSGYAQRFMP